VIDCTLGRTEGSLPVSELELRMSWGCDGVFVALNVGSKRQASPLYRIGRRGQHRAPREGRIRVRRLLSRRPVQLYRVHSIARPLTGRRETDGAYFCADAIRSWDRRNLYFHVHLCRRRRRARSLLLVAKAGLRFVDTAF
jgi:hypothetical protein